MDGSTMLLECIFHPIMVPTDAIGMMIGTAALHPAGVAIGRAREARWLAWRLAQPGDQGPSSGTMALRYLGPRPLVEDGSVTARSSVLANLPRRQPLESCRAHLSGRVQPVRSPCQ